MQITSWHDVDKALRRLGMLIQREARAEAATKPAMQRIRDRLARILKPLRAQRKGLLGRLERFTFRHQDELQERTLVLGHGAVALRKTPAAIVLDKDEADVVRLLKERRLYHCVRIKEEVDKEALARHDDSILDAVGCHRESRDEFKWRLAGETEWR